MVPNFLMAESQGIAAADRSIDLMLTGVDNYITDFYLKPKTIPYAGLSICYLMCSLVGVSKMINN